MLDRVLKNLLDGAAEVVIGKKPDIIRERLASPRVVALGIDNGLNRGALVGQPIVCTNHGIHHGCIGDGALKGLLDGIEDFLLGHVCLE